MIPKLTSPLTKQEVKEMVNKENVIEAVLDIHLSDLIDNDLEGINNLVEELILEEGILSDISYTTVAASAETNEVTILVTAIVDAEYLDNIEV